MNSLYYGDNLKVLRDSIPDESVDLIYLDPPFNSRKDYNVLFKSPEGHDSDAQLEAFEDSWSWGEQAEREFAELLGQANTEVTEMMRALRGFMGESDVMAYLTMMANRLLELHRVLKPSGSMYLHCDPTASHYLKIVLDMVFGPGRFRNEIVWHYYNKFQRGDIPMFARDHDIIFFYTKEPERQHHFESIYEMREKPVMQLQRKWDKETGRIVNKKDEEGHVIYEEKVDRKIDDVWRMPYIVPASKEGLGYPTQKPLALLERIIMASSKPGDLVLDPFCGCGTAVHAAQKHGRDWIGIDITHLAIGLIEKRLKDAFPGIEFSVHGTPQDIGGARDLFGRDPYEFQWWAVSLVNALPWGGRKRGADAGIDGLLYFQDEEKGQAKKIIVSVKGGDTVHRDMIADLKNTVEREKAQMGWFVTLAKPTKPMIKEAVSAGFYTSPQGIDYPKIQILTVEGLMAGHERPQYLDLAHGKVGRRKAQTEKASGQQPPLL